MKTKNNYNLQPFNAGAQAKIGYKHVDLVAKYQFTELFRHNKGPELYPFSIALIATF